MQASLCPGLKGNVASVLDFKRLGHERSTESKRIYMTLLGGRQASDLRFFMV